MTNIQRPNTRQPNGSDPTIKHESSEKKAGGERSPQKQGPGHMQDDDMKHKRGGGNVERETPEEEDEGSTRQGGHSQPDMGDEETGGRSRPGPGRSRNM